MRILHALSQTELTGSEVYAWELCEHQARAGHELWVVSDKLHKPFQGKTLTMSLSTGSPWQRMKNIFRLRQILKTNDIDVIHCHSRGACRHLFWASRGLGIAMVTSLHGRQHASFSKRLFDIYGDLIITICERIAEQLRDNFRMSPHKIEVLRNPVSVKAATASSAPSGKPRVVLIGRSSGPKGERLMALMRSQAEHWRKEFPQAQLTLALSGLSDSAKAALSQELKVEVLGSIPTLADLIQSSSVVIASGRVAIEALLMNRRVLALGESEYLGEVTLENIDLALKSNFGDVGRVRPLPFAEIGADVTRIVGAAITGPDPELLARIRHEFDPNRIASRIEELYKGARLFQRARWIPILMYHKVLKTDVRSRHRIFVREKTFAQHLKFFRRRGFTFMHFSELADFWNGRKSLREFPRRPLILTFDDGYKNNRENALPLLEKFEAKATIFALTDPLVTYNSWDVAEGEPREELMSVADLRELPSDLIEIGSHGFRHERLTEKSEEEVFDELRQSRATLKTLVPRAPVSVFAYAYGAVDPRLPRLAQKADYDFAVNTDTGPVMWIKDRWSLFRVNVFPEDNWFSLWKKTSPWYREYYFRKRGK